MGKKNALRNYPLVNWTRTVTVTETIRYDLEGNIKSKKTTLKVREVTIERYRSVEHMRAAITLGEVNNSQDEINVMPTTKNANTFDMNCN